MLADAVNGPDDQGHDGRLGADQGGARQTAIHVEAEIGPRSQQHQY